MTVNGVTTTTNPGQEQYEFFQRKVGGKWKEYCSYDYRYTDEMLFTCVKPTLEACRAMRDIWLQARKQ
jgi:hypothetical protein